jgi:hypothetical protein
VPATFDLLGEGEWSFDQEKFIQRKQDLARVHGIMCFVYSIPAHKLFDDPDWMTNYIYNRKVALEFWSEYRQAMRGAYR